MSRVVQYLRIFLPVLAFALTTNKVLAEGLVIADSTIIPGINIELKGTPLTIDSSTFVLPFSRAGNLVLVQARADTTEGNFILDTGSPGVVLNLTYFRNYPTEESPEERKGITSTEFMALQTRIADFTLGAVHYYHLSADLANLGNIENAKGVRILGLIGMQLLTRFEMIIDYEKNLIYLHRIGRKEASSYHHELLNDTSTYRTVPITLTDDRIIVQTTMAGKKLKFVIDSGAESNLLDSRLPDKVFEKIAITGRSVLSGLGNTKIEVLKGNIGTFQIGNQSIENLPVLITNLEKTCFAYGGCVDGILGFDFLSLKKIGFNFVTNKMYIWK